MTTFKVGDLITGNESNNYGFTDKTAICKVVRIADSGFMDVVVVKSPHYSGSTEFTVKESKFKLVRPIFKGSIK